MSAPPAPPRISLPPVTTCKNREPNPEPLYLRTVQLDLRQSVVATQALESTAKQALDDNSYRREVRAQLEQEQGLRDALLEDLELAQRAEYAAHLEAAHAQNLENEVQRAEYAARCCVDLRFGVVQCVRKEGVTMGSQRAHKGLTRGAMRLGGGDGAWAQAVVTERHLACDPLVTPL
eukprot:741153-Prorocentrum_minimum.AAC.1